MSEKKYVIVYIDMDNASKRTKERFFRFENDEIRIEVLNHKINETLKGDGFVPGEPMTYFRINKFQDNIWSNAWEGWIPDCEIEIEEITDEVS